MKILLVSDTHGRTQRLLNVVAKHEAEMEACIHLGDGATDADQVQAIFPRLPLYVALGNCDFSYDQTSEGVESFGGVRVFYTHGHRYGVKDSLLRLAAAAKERNASVALYGHTHVPNYFYQNGIHLFNPGSLCMPRMGPATYGMLTINDSAPIPSFAICEYE